MLVSKFVKFLMSILKRRQVNSSSNFASFFIVTTHNSSVNFKLIYFLLWITGSHQNPILRLSSALVKICQIFHVIFQTVVTKTSNGHKRAQTITNQHKRVQTITNHQQMTTSCQQTTTNYQQMNTKPQQTTTKHHQTTTNDQIDLFPNSNYLIFL